MARLRPEAAARSNPGGPRTRFEKEVDWMAPDEERWELEDGTDLTDEEIRQVEAQLARDLEAERGQRREAAFRIATGVAGAILFGSILVWTIGTAIYPFVSNAVQGAAVEGQAGWELNL